ncbi:MFS transporter [Rhodococcus fascians]|nr:MFS transporter [Rhodococcus fascians]MBY4237890.1 MFS transporter [Rhodococcus fascians]MBY4253359.1 MFS transporter [Rhodococcus fascians]MBY4268996.1 MFS transporter [Rhodococcus fascians]MBY4275049.1 MFS transporter [Rhodococcus fascians]
MTVFMDVREAIRTTPMRRYQLRTIAICLVLSMVDGFEILIMAFVAPHLGKDWGLSSVEIGWLLSAGIIGTALGAIFISPLADRIGRRTLAIWCLGAIVIGMGLSAAAMNVPQMIAFRTFAGIGIGGLVANLNVLVAEYSSDKRRGSALGIYAMGYPLGGALGGAISGILIAEFGWRSAFLFGTVLTAVLLAVVIRALPESIEFLVEKRPKDALAKYNTVASKLGYTTATQLPAQLEVVRNAVRTGLFEGIMLWRTSALWLGYSCLIAAFYFANTWTPKLLSDSSGDPNLGVTAGILISVGGVLGSLIFAGLAMVMRPRVVTVLLMVGGAIAFGAYANGFQVAAVALALALCVGIFAAGGVTAFYAISPPIYPTAVRGTGVGFMIGCGRTVSIVAPILTGYLLNMGLAPKDLYVGFGGVMIVAGIAVVLLDLTYRQKKSNLPAEHPRVESASA